MSSKKTKKLTAEDRELWNRVTRTAKPLKTQRVSDALLGSAASKGTINSPVVTKASPSLADNSVRKPVAAPPKPLQPTLDAPTRKKIAKGRQPIDGRIDLHGMTQAEAHGALLAYLSRAHATGLRHVLVITGKGASLRSEGVLNRALPSWLATAPFRALVSGFDLAARHHGGSGAYYLRLRRKRVPGEQP